MDTVEKHIEVIRLLWIVENSFVFDNVKAHGISLDFLVNPIDWVEKLNKNEFYGFEDDFKVIGTRYENLEDFRLTFRWFDISELDSISIKPKVYHKALKNIPDHPVLLRNLEVEK
ncbi:MAG: hypothetical protein ACFFDI_20555 [Promethearchaeota archaeon]